MKVIVFNVYNKERLNLYRKFFKESGFEFLGVLYDRDDIQLSTRYEEYGLQSDKDKYEHQNDKDKYNIYTIKDLKNLDFDLIMAHNNQIQIVYQILASLNIPPSKSRILYYDFNNVQKILGNDNIKCLFYDKYETVNGKLKHDLEYKRLNGKFKESVSNLSEEEKKKTAALVYDSYKKQMEALSDVTDVYNVGSNWQSYMCATRPLFYNACKNNDLSTITELLSNFFRNCMSTGMFGGEDAYNGFLATRDFYGIYFDCYKAWLGRTGISEPDIDELCMSPEGGAYGADIEGKVVNINSFLFHSRAKMIKNLLGDNEKSIVAEIGGGTGLLGHYLMKITKNITYIDFDLPDNLISASYYLKASFPNKKILLFDSKKPLKRGELLKYDMVLMPNYMVPYLEDKSIDMFINTISFGEMNYEAICEYYSQIERCGKKYFYHENLFAPQGDYECFPVAVYPKLKNYKLMYQTPSPWVNVFDSTNRNHMFVEQLFERKN